jgi:hypothetical protein
MVDAIVVELELVHQKHHVYYAHKILCFWINTQWPKLQKVQAIVTIPLHRHVIAIPMITLPPPPPNTHTHTTNIFV